MIIGFYASVVKIISLFFMGDWDTKGGKYVHGRKREYNNLYDLYFYQFLKLKILWKWKFQKIGKK